ncbi:hypothetical protein CB1_000388024 [Camelus ferus]|nr:hypothetical protein CB1_000388024 [Camelus ferus]
MRSTPSSALRCCTAETGAVTDTFGRPTPALTSGGAVSCARPVRVGRAVWLGTCGRSPDARMKRLSRKRTRLKVEDPSSGFSPAATGRLPSVGGPVPQARVWSLRSLWVETALSGQDGPALHPPDVGAVLASASWGEGVHTCMDPVGSLFDSAHLGSGGDWTT